jgi:hypothetical protein
VVKIPGGHAVSVLTQKRLYRVTKKKNGHCLAYSGPNTEMFGRKLLKGQHSGPNTQMFGQHSFTALSCIVRGENVADPS